MMPAPRKTQMLKLALPFIFAAVVRRLPDGSTPYPLHYYGKGDDFEPEKTLDEVTSDEGNRRRAEKIAELYAMLAKLRKR